MNQDTNQCPRYGSLKSTLETVRVKSIIFRLPKIFIQASFTIQDHYTCLVTIAYTIQSHPVKYRNQQRLPTLTRSWLLPLLSVF